MKKLLVSGIVFLSLIYFMGCGMKDNNNSVDAVSNETVQNSSDETTQPSEAFLAKYNRCSFKTKFELLRAMIATAKYHDIKKAIKDGYADINVIIPNMGYHYLKAANLDDKFEVTKPELLVYSKDPHNGKMKLVAIEYAVPLELMPDNPPEGFTGSQDVWDKNLTFNLWTLHAWVWKFNPSGVFNPTNPNVP